MRDRGPVAAAAAQPEQPGKWSIHWDPAATRELGRRCGLDGNSRRKSSSLRKQVFRTAVNATYGDRIDLSVAVGHASLVNAAALVRTNVRRVGLLWRNLPNGSLTISHRVPMQGAVRIPMILVGLAVFSARLGTHAVGQPGSTAGQLALVGGTIYTSPTEEPLHEGVVLIREGKIATVGRKTSVQLPRNTQTIDCSGLTIAAGFWNSHVHFFERKWSNVRAIPAPEPIDSFRTCSQSTASLQCSTSAHLWRTRVGFATASNLGKYQARRSLAGTTRNAPIVARARTSDPRRR